MDVAKPLCLIRLKRLWKTSLVFFGLVGMRNVLDTSERLGGLKEFLEVCT